MRLVRFLAALAAAAVLQFAGTRLWPAFPRAVDLFPLVAMLEARHGRPVSGMFAGMTAGLIADALSGGPFGLHGFANTAVAYGTGRAAQQLVVQRNTSLAAIFAAGAAAQQAILAALALVFRDRAELPDPFWLPVQVGSAAFLGLAWTHASAALARRFRFWQKNRTSKLQMPS